jgi:hypothetical protein
VLHDLALGLELGRDRFEREALALSRLSSPHTVRLIDFGITQSGPIGVRNLRYMVIELIEGEDLERRLHRGSLHPDDLLDILDGVADSLAEAHAAGTIRRDPKPSNVILTCNHTGRVVPKVIDFGIARIEGASKSQTGFVTGTPSSMGPEQVRGEAELDDGATAVQMPTPLTLSSLPAAQEAPAPAGRGVTRVFAIGGAAVGLVGLLTWGLVSNRASEAPNAPDAAPGVAVAQPGPPVSVPASSPVRIAPTAAPESAAPVAVTPSAPVSAPVTAPVSAPAPETRATPGTRAACRGAGPDRRPGTTHRGGARRGPGRVPMSAGSTPARGVAGRPARWGVRGSAPRPGGGLPQRRRGPSMCQRSTGRGGVVRRGFPQRGFLGQSVLDVRSEGHPGPAGHGLRPRHRDSRRA